MKKAIFIFFSFCISLTLCGCATDTPKREIAAYLEGLDAIGSFSGVVLVAKDGKPIFEQALGLANRNYDVPNQLDTKFNLGSMNKMFTAVAILQLVEQGKLAVNDTILKHIPHYPNQDVGRKVTIHQLLTHTSGMGDIFTNEYLEKSKDQFRELHDYLPLFVDKPLQFEPGSQGAYSNAGFLVLGLIIEEISGQTYFDYIRENIYQPCGMINTDSYETDKVVPNMAVGYSWNLSNGRGLSSNLYFHPVRGSSAGGGYSTVEDMLKFSNCLVNYQLLSQELTEVLLAGKVSSPSLGEGAQYGYGFSVIMMDGHRIVGHGGGAPGVCANLDVFMDTGYTAVVLSNRDYDCLQVKKEIREILLKQAD